MADRKAHPDTPRRGLRLRAGRWALWMAEHWRTISAVTTDTARLGCMWAWGAFVAFVALIIHTLDHSAPFIKDTFLAWLDGYTPLPNRLTFTVLLLYVFGPVAGSYLKVVRRQLAVAAWKRSLPRPQSRPAVTPRRLIARPRGCSVVLLTAGVPIAALALGFMLVTQYNRWAWPLPTQTPCRSSAPFGAPNPAGAQPAHTGIDFCKAPGTPITAVAGGVVEWAGWWPPESEALGSGHGLTVWINHGLGEDGRPVYSVYAHASELKVIPGQPVLRGQTVALLGGTGYGTGPHLHFAVARQSPQSKQWRVGIDWEDPYNYLGAGVFTADIRLYALVVALVVGAEAALMLVSAWRAHREPGVDLRVRAAVTAQYMANNWDYLAAGYSMAVLRVFGAAVALAAAGVLGALVHDPLLWLQAATTVHNRFLAVLALLLLAYLLLKRLPFTGALFALLVILVSGGVLITGLGLLPAVVVVGITALALWLFMPRPPRLAALLAAFTPTGAAVYTLALISTLVAVALIGLVWVQTGPLLTLASVLFVLTGARSLHVIDYRRYAEAGEPPPLWEGRALATGALLVALGALGAQMIVPASGHLASFFPATVQRWALDIYRWAGAYGLNPNAVATIMTIESCGWPDVTSPAGAAGLFQVMPFHFTPGDDLYDPDANARAGLAFYARLLQTTGGDVGEALAAYNGGLGTVRRPMTDWPAETRAYYRWGTGIYAEAVAGLPSSATLEAWLRAGGASLCEGRVGR